MTILCYAILTYIDGVYVGQDGNQLAPIADGDHLPVVHRFQQLDGP
jgi:hypothetical protein